MSAAGTLLQATSLDAVSTQAWMRLLKACALSLVLHLVVLVGVPVNPTGGVPQVVTTITARLEPAAAENEPVAESVALEPDTPPAPIADHPLKPAEPKTEIKPEPPRAKDPASSPSVGIEMPFIRDPTYYTPKQLDVIPELLSRITLVYPESAKDVEVEGRLRILLLIDEFGVVNEASVLEANPGGYFEEATLAVYRVARFSPAQRQGHAVKCRIILAVVYPARKNAGAGR